ncbi:unnamed protein product [Calicophoron daubneyi]|uniref:Trematode PH-like domain-containing protein n=1 Tax=Calicophoron daubneyi TaxID=300641 RepID=A0AAV2TQU9_CALDB
MPKKKPISAVNPYIRLPVDRKTKQVVQKEIRVAQMGRSKVKNETQFSETTAQSLAEQHLKKRRSLRPAYFLVDRIRFEGGGFHQYLTYREIQRCYRFMARPDVFMLYTVSEKNGEHAYETYKCRDPADVEAIRDLIYAASSDPQRLLQDVGPTRLASMSSSSSSEYYVDKKGQSMTPRSRSLEQSYYPAPRQYIAPEPTFYDPPQHVQAAATSRTPVTLYDAEDGISSDEEYPLEVVRMGPKKSVKSVPPTNANTGSGLITYLRNDNVHGTYIADDGPIYMYVSRSKPSPR